MTLKRTFAATCMLALISAPAFAQSSTNCDFPDASAATAHFDGAWKVSSTDAKSGEVGYTYQDCSNPVRFNALDSTQLAREGGVPVRVIEMDGSTIMWIDERGQAFATKPLNGSFMLMRYGYGQNRSEYDQVLRYDRCPVEGSTCSCAADAAP